MSTQGMRWSYLMATPVTQTRAIRPLKHECVKMLTQCTMYVHAMPGIAYVTALYLLVIHSSMVFNTFYEDKPENNILSMKQISEVKGNPFTSSLNICSEACCRKIGVGGVTPPTLSHAPYTEPEFVNV
jgi:hypothetical protein